MNVLLSTAYWPNLLYCRHLVTAGNVTIEQHEHFPKQSFRNRAQILSANGVLDLSIPVAKKTPKELTRDIKISYQEKWQVNHWRAITSAYRNSPYFEYFEADVLALYDKRFDSLLEYNLLQLSTIFRILRIKKEISLTGSFVPGVGTGDLRDKIHPKIKASLDADLLNPYYQTFGEKFGFIPNLSILDLLFNTGLNSLNYLSGERV